MYKNDRPITKKLQLIPSLQERAFLSNLMYAAGASNGPNGGLSSIWRDVILYICENFLPTTEEYIELKAKYPDAIDDLGRDSRIISETQKKLEMELGKVYGTDVKVSIAYVKRA